MTYAAYMVDPDEYDDYDSQYPRFSQFHSQTSNNSNDFPYEPPPITTDELFAKCKWVEKKISADVMIPHNDPPAPLVRDFFLLTPFLLHLFYFPRSVFTHYCSKEETRKCLLTFLKL